MHDDDATIFMGVPDRTDVMAAPAYVAPEAPRARRTFPWKVVLGIEAVAAMVGIGAVGWAATHPNGDAKVVAGYPPVTSLTTLPEPTLTTVAPAAPLPPTTRRARRTTTSQRRSTTTSTS